MLIAEQLQEGTIWRSMCLQVTTGHILWHFSHFNVTMREKIGVQSVLGVDVVVS